MNGTIHEPVLIQGGMGMGVSNWVLARAVSELGHLGVVSGTAIDSILARRLQDGDPGGHMRRALEHFPAPTIAQKILRDYYLPDGRAPGTPYKRIPMFSLEPLREVFALSVAANFVEIFLAKEGHSGCVGINLLHKIHLPNLSSLYGAMLANVDVVLMGAGIPRDIPDILEKLARHEPAEMKIPVEGAGPEEAHSLRFDPAIIFGRFKQTPLKRPRFFPIISSATLAIALARKCEGRVDGFIVEGALAGGHNAPPRGPLSLNERGEPIYGPRDEADLAKIKALGLPFWLAGSYAEPQRLAEARAQGAAGIQVGTAFAFCRESGVAESIKQAVIDRALSGIIDVFTDPVASPTGFPFKVIRLPGSVSEENEYRTRSRRCDLGYLREAYKRPDGAVGYRCSSESPQTYARKGGRVSDTSGRKCLCNGLLADIGLAQIQSEDYVEKPFMTSGEDVKCLARFLEKGQRSYSAKDVVNFIFSSSL